MLEDVPPKPALTFIGVLPPPHNGMTIASANMLARLEDHVDLRTRGISSPRFARSRWWKAVRGWNYIKAAQWLGKAELRPGETLYFVANSKKGLRYDIALLEVAVSRRIPVILQHQVYAYLWQHDANMERVCRLLEKTPGHPAGGLHLCLCDDMADRLRSMYHITSDTMLMPNGLLDEGRAEVGDHAAGWRSVAARREPHERLRLGHISNLTIEKGLGIVLDTFAAMHDKNLPVDLYLAGPCNGPREQVLVDECQVKFGEHLHVLGPVYDQAKWDFFAKIDLMLFPTQYANEAQPLVIAEAMATGVPTIAFARACIPAMLGDTGGVCIDVDDEFVAAALPTLVQWCDDRTLLYEAQRCALEQGNAFHAFAEGQVGEIVKWLSSK